MSIYKEDFSQKKADKYILVKSCRVNNLKGIDLALPRSSFIVVTGLSGSGKSSLAFDTLYAEGQRRYVESLSAYARQFLDRMPKPQCDYIKGIPPAIAIEQKQSSSNPRSTVATSSEIYDFLKLLFARIGRFYSPKTGREIKRHSPQDLAQTVTSLSDGFVVYISVDIAPMNGELLRDRFLLYAQQGYNRILKGSTPLHIEEFLSEVNIDAKEPYALLIDRIRINTRGEQEAINELYRRVVDSSEIAFEEGSGHCTLHIISGDKKEEKISFSNRFEENGILYREPSPEMFAFNNAYGACPECEGFAYVLGIDPSKVIPDESLSVHEGAVRCWSGIDKLCLEDFEKKAIKTHQFPIFKAYRDLTKREKELLWKGDSENEIYGINDYFNWLSSRLYKIGNRVRLSKFRGRTLCPRCKGNRLQDDALMVKINGKNISQICRMTIQEAHQFFKDIQLNEQESIIAKRLLSEIVNRLRVLENVGLSYLSLDRSSNTLSGGETQRISLSKQLGNSLVGSLYVLDEPSIGLHQKDTARLISVLKELQALGNTVLVVEHDKEVMQAADYILDIGPEAGIHGGEVVFFGTIGEMTTSTPGYTAAYLLGKEKTEQRPQRNAQDYIFIQAAYKNNLKYIDVSFPLHLLCTVVGVSGSGKSTLVKEVLCASLESSLEAGEPIAVACKAIGRDYRQIAHIEYVDQHSVGKSSRSNPATYLGIYDDIRALFAAQEQAKIMGLSVNNFSFNSDGGRCEECKGEGFVTIEMQFMADIKIPCESCSGKRFQKHILEILYNGKNVYDILCMSVREAIDFFKKDPRPSVRQTRILESLQVLDQVGLSYLQLGQSSSTLSGGENQRLKLAHYLRKSFDKPTLYIFDEPTTGLHFHDINLLLRAFNALIDKGHSLIVIEHNPDFIQASDYIIELGPQGGPNGGELIFSGSRTAYFQR